MNAPDRFLKFVVPEGQPKVSFARDTKIANAGAFQVLCEDHTLGNTVRMQLHRNPEVLFAAYQVPHPLANHVLIRIQTTKRTTPVEALKNALEELKGEMSDIKGQFIEQVRDKRQAPAATAAYGY